jgi:lysophospholipase L1-like esterase
VSLEILEEDGTSKQVAKIECGDTLLWKTFSKNYISFGDSIAAGHLINPEWKANNLEATQYSYNGRTESTQIVEGCYTDLIRDELLNKAPDKNVVSTVSFARSGDKVHHLINKVDDAPVEHPLKKADLVTLCIGANNVLGPALDYIPTYAADLTNNLGPLESQVEENFKVLQDRTNAGSYYKLFEELTKRNQNAQYIFTTIYNPYKYLHADNHFFDPVKNAFIFLDIFSIDIDKLISDMLFGGKQLAYPTIENWTIKWNEIDWSISVYDIVSAALDLVVSLAQYKLNSLGPWAEAYINRLNQIIRDETGSYKNTNSNFNVAIAESKARFDTFPGRTDGSQGLDYTNLVNCQLTRGYDTNKVSWNLLWEIEGMTASEYIWDKLDFKMEVNQNKLNGLLNDVISGSVDLNMFSYVNITIQGVRFDSADDFVNAGHYGEVVNKMASEILTDLFNNVLLTEMDVHPKADGHKEIYKAFTEHIDFEN